MVYETHKSIGQMTNYLPPLLKRLSFLLIFTFVLFFSLSFLVDSSRQNKNRFDLSSISMCTSTGPLINYNEAKQGPLAPQLDLKWDHTFTVTTNSREAQTFFDQGMFFTYAFNHAEAERSFREAARLDPSCAMAYWGVALALGPNINRPMQSAVTAEALKYSKKALVLSANVSPVEKALIEALSKRYIENPPENRIALDQIYAEEMRLVAHRFRENVDVLTLFAEALMDTMPWDYWQADGSPKAATREMHATLDYVLEKMPDHPGANHYYIHSVEAVQPEIAEKCADKLTEIEYKSGHLVHMPSHIYIRLGRYQDSNIANAKAIELDEEYITSCNEQGYYPSSYYPHNIHFLWFGAAMSGQSKLAMEAAHKTVDKSDRERFAILPLYTYIRFGMWDEILATPEPNASKVYLNTIWQFAQGMAHIKKNNLKQAKNQLNILKKRSKNKVLIEMQNPFWPVQEMAQLSYIILAGEVAALKKNYNLQVNLLKEAVKLQDQFTYMEPPFYYMQLKQYLGDAQLKAGNASAAESTFREELKTFPNNGWSLYGLYQSLEKQQKKEEAQKIYQQFQDAWAEADVELSGSVF